MAKDKKGSAFFIIAFLFLLFGLLLIGDASLIEAQRTFGDKFYFLKRQLIWAGVGGVLFLIGAKLNYRFWEKLAFFFFALSLIPLALVLLPSFGQIIGGSRRWLSLGEFTFQPSELVKFSLITYLAAILAKKKIDIFQLFLVLLLPVGLTLLEPDFGTSVIMVMAGMVLWFLAGVPLRKIIIPSFIFIALGILLIYISPYRLSRVKGMADPFYDPQGKSYHSYQLVLTLGSGGLAGVGMGQSWAKYQYLPYVTTDSIMAVVGEEFGLIGLSVVITSFMFLLYSGFQIVKKTSDNFAKLLVSGFVAWLGIQAFVNLSAVAIVMPLTGVPFPFVSYGGSSLVLSLFSLGIIFNIWQCS
ncbi:MAG: putative peptidoglycan glycosyltransferase FtsW [Candidatus Shapirobacteria bacterium]